MANNIKMEWKEISVRAMSIIESHIGSSSASSDAISQLRDLIAAALANESTTATNNDTDIKKDTKSPPIFTAVHQAIIDALWFCGTQIQGDASLDTSWGRLCQLVKDIHSGKLITADQLRLSLDVSLLAAAGLAPEEKSTQNMLVRINTRILYRQQKYNLLREEAEGFSKLVAILNKMPERNCDSYIKNILATIGQFDLDPNRVLEIVLASFENQPTNYSFLKLLKYFRAEHIVHVLGLEFTFYSKEALAANEDASITKTSATVSLTQPEDVELPAPESLYAVAAALIGSEMIDLQMLVPYLSPSTETIISHCESVDISLVKDVLDYGVISLNAGKKSSESEPSSKITAQTTNVIITHSSQDYAHGFHSIGLATGLIRLNCFELACELLNPLDRREVDVMRFDVTKNSVQTLLLWKLAPIYDNISMKKMQLAAPVRKDVVSSSQNGLMSEDIEIGSPIDTIFPSAESLITGLFDFPSQAISLLRLLGHRVGDNPVLFTHVCRLLRHRACQVKESISSEDSAMMADIVGSILLPSLTASEGSVFLASQIWTAISSLPFSLRYEIYDIWYCGSTGKAAMKTKHIDVAYMEAKALHQTKSLLKRLAKENTKIIGRQLSKIAHYAPLVVFEYILNQIEHYDNLIPYVVDALKYTSDLAKDTLSYFFIISLQRNASNKMRKGQTFFSTWFTTLSKFIAHFFKKYSNTEIRGIIHYLLIKLGKDCECYDLLVLKNLLSVMGGCDVSLLEISLTQVEGLSGGKILKSEVMGASVKDPPSKRAIRTLRDSLIQSNAAIPMLLFIAQINNRILYQKTSDADDIKLISHLYDMSQDVLMQFIDFLMNPSSNSNTTSKGSNALDASGNMAKSQEEMIIGMMPSLSELVNDIGLSFPVAFQLTRPLFRQALSYGIELINCPSHLIPWHPLNENFLQLLQTSDMIPQEVWDFLSPEMYMIFWCLSIYDISVPSNAYSVEIKRCKDRYAELDTKPLTGNPSWSESEKAKQKCRNDLNKILGTIKDLTAEQEQQKKHVETTKKIILKMKDKFFRYSPEKSFSLISEYAVQYCVLPRASLSPMDAIFSTQFFFLLHEYEASYFSTIHFMDRIVKTMTPLLFSYTEAEASFLGFLFHNLMTTATRWQQSKALFELEARSKIGFSVDIVTTSPDDNQLTKDEIRETKESAMRDVTLSSSRISFEDYERVFRLWQNIIKTALRHLLGSSEYIHLRSALIFLTQISQYFPVNTSTGDEILKDIEKLEKQEVKRPDLQVMAKSVWALMKRRSISWKNDSAPATSATNAAIKGADGTHLSRKSDAKSMSDVVDSVVSAKVSLSLEKMSQRGHNSDGMEAGEEREDNNTIAPTSLPSAPVKNLNTANTSTDSNRGTKRKVPPVEDRWQAQAPASATDSSVRKNTTSKDEKQDSRDAKPSYASKRVKSEDTSMSIPPPPPLVRPSDAAPSATASNMKPIEKIPSTSKNRARANSMDTKDSKNDGDVQHNSGPSATLMSRESSGNLSTGSGQDKKTKSSTETSRPQRQSHDNDKDGYHDSKGGSRGGNASSRGSSEHFPSRDRASSRDQPYPSHVDDRGPNSGYQTSHDFHRKQEYIPAAIFPHGQRPPYPPPPPMNAFPPPSQDQRRGSRDAQGNPNSYSGSRHRR